MANERFAADDGQVQRPVLVDEREDAVDQRLAFQVADIAERDRSTEVIVAVGITARAAERTLAGDFNREVRSIAKQNLAPSANHALHEYSFDPQLVLGD
jgi:hypothetical protein